MATRNGNHKTFTRPPAPQSPPWPGVNGNGKHVALDVLQPHNVEAEEAVLGALLIDPDAWIRIDNKLSADKFFLGYHAWVFAVIENLHRDGSVIDPVTVADALERQSQLEDLGGPAYLSDLINRTPTSIHVVHYANIVERTYILRQVIAASTKMVEAAHDPNADTAAVLDQAEAEFLAISDSRNRGGFSTTEAGVSALMDRTEYLQENPNTTPGIPTGLKDLDRLLGGLQKTDLIILAGRPGMGKSALALSVSMTAAKLKRKVGVFSLEMSDEQLITRMVSAESGIDSQRIKFGQIRDDEWPVYLQGSDSVAAMSVFIDDTSAISVMELRAKSRRLLAEKGLDLLVVDYMQLMRGDTKSENRQQEISLISRSLKELARELKIPVLALSQLSRACESRHDKRPILSDLRESGSIEQDADVVLFVYRDEMYNPDTEFPSVAELIVSKHRSGPTGAFSVYFKKSITRFVDLEVKIQPLDYGVNK